MTAELSDTPTGKPVKSVPIWAGLLVILLFLGGVALMVMWLNHHRGASRPLNASTERVVVASGTVTEAGGGAFRATLNDAMLFATKSKDTYNVNLSLILNERPWLHEEEIQPMHARQKILAVPAAAAQILHVTPEQIVKLKSDDFKALDMVEFGQNMKVPVKLTEANKATLAPLVAEYAKADKSTKEAAQTKLLQAMYEISEEHFTRVQQTLRQNINQIPKVLTLSQIVDSNRLPRAQAWPRGLPTTQQAKRWQAATRAAATQTAAAATQPGTVPSIVEAILTPTPTTKPATQPSTRPVPRAAP